MVGTADCNAFIQNSKSRLSSQCQTSLQSFDPTRGDLPVCDGRLLRNIADKYIFVVQLYNYTRAWCDDGLHPMLIYFNITQIIECERAIRHGLKNSPEAYSVYDTLSKDLLHVYVHNLNNYREFSDPRLWDDEEDEDSNSSATKNHRADIARSCCNLDLHFLHIFSCKSECFLSNYRAILDSSFPFLLIPTAIPVIFSLWSETGD